jgi:5-methylcytosine-specific restriction endonuclease McrA
MGTPLDLTGRVFGRLTAVERLHKDKHHKYQWRCVCSCGSEAIASAGNLTKGNSTSCGCARRETLSAVSRIDLVGRVFGRLTVRAYERSSERGQTFWRCRCECGAELVVLGDNLRNENTVSCGCARGRTPYRSAAKRAQSAVGVLNRRARREAAGGKFTAAQIQRLYGLQRGKCAGCACSLGDAYHRDHIVSLKQGGTNDILNIQLLCGPCNVRKHAKDPIRWAQENGRLL